MPFVPIEGALGAVKTGFELIKSVRELLKKDKVNPAEANRNWRRNRAGPVLHCVLG